MRKTLSGALAIGLFVTSSVAVSPSSSFAATNTPIPPAMTTQLHTMTTSLAMIGMLEELTGPIPGLDESVATLVDLELLFAGVGAAASGTQADFQVAIDALESGNALGSWDVSGIDVATTGSTTTIGFNAALPSVVKQANLTMVNGDLQLLGTALDVAVSVSPAHFTFEYDAISGLALTEFPDLTFGLDVDATLTDETVVLGFAQATLEGSVKVDTGVQLGFVDPDGDGRITAAELSGLAIPDAFTLDPVVASPDDIDVDLSLSADVFGQVFTGTLTLSDESIFSGAAPQPALTGTGSNPIDVFTNFSAESAITAISQLVSTFGGAMIGGDVDIPLLGDGVFLPADLGADPAGFDKVFEAIQPLLDYVKPRAEGQIVCGTASASPDGGVTDGVPYGSILNLSSAAPADTAQCRVYAAGPVQPGSVTWAVTSGNATLGDSTTGAGADGTASDAPTQNANFTMTADGELEVSVTYTLLGESDSITIVQRADTVQELLLELLDAGLIEGVGDIPNVTYNADLQAIEFNLGISGDPAERSVSVNAGDELIAETGLGGLSGSAAGGLDIGAIAAATTVGLILADDPADINPDDNAEFPPGPGDRLFLRNTDELLTVSDVELTASAALSGRLGFLEVTADLTASVSKPAGADPALQVGFTPIGLEVDGYIDPDATSVTSLLRAGPDGFNANVNLALAGSLDVDANVPGITAGGTIDIAWDFNDPRPDLDVSTDFTNNLFPFDTSEELTYTGAVPTDETLFTVAAPGGLLAQAGLVGSKLVDADSNTCTITSVTSDTELRCENGTSVGDLNPITFANGTSYQITGNTLAHLAKILAAIDGLTGYLETMIGDAAFNEPIPVLGISAGDLVGQIQKLRSMVDEFRGIQDGQLVCTVTAPPFTGSESSDRAIKTADGNATLGCKAAASTSNPTGIQWRINDVTAGDATPGAWVDGAGTVGSAPAATAALTLAGLDDNGDGYINLGSEYTVEVEWTEGGELSTSALPPRTPQSLQQLAQSVTDILGLPDGAFGLDLTPGTNAILQIDLAYAFCSSTAPTGYDLRCAGMPTGPAPSVNLNFDLGGALPDFVGFETTGDLIVKYAAAGQFDIGIPLNGDSPVLYGTTGLDVAVQVEGTDLSLTASIGPIEATLGSAAVLTGEADNVDGDDAPAVADDTLLIDGAVDLSGVVDGTPVTRVSDGLTCDAAGTGAADQFTCDLGLDGDNNQVAWGNGDAYRIGGLGELNAGLEFNVAVANSGTPLADGDSIPIFDGTSFNPALGIDATSFSQLGSASCEPFDSSRFTETVVLGVDDTDEVLSGLACGLLSMQLNLGTASVYVGELALDWDGADLAVYTPADLATRLADALLSPAFLLRALPPVLATIESGLRDAAGSVPAAVGDPLLIGADGVGALKDAAQFAIDEFGAALDAIADVDILATTVDDELTALLQPDDEGLPVDLAVEVVVTTDCNGDCAGLPITDLEDISVQLVFTATVEATTGVNLGLEALPISFDAGVRGYATFTAVAGLGVSRNDGPYLRLNDAEADPDNPDGEPTTGPEVSLTAGVELSEDGPSDCAAPMADLADDYTTDRCMRGRLAFLFIEALDATGNGPDQSGISATVSLDITSSDPKVTLSNIGSLGVEPNVSGAIDLNLHIRTGIQTEFTTTADLPSVLGTLSLSWGADAQGGIDPLVMSFDNLNLDIGSFLTEFMGPIVKEVKKITGPLQPIVDILTAPIPVVSDLAELVGSDPITMISLLEVASGADLSLVKALAAFISFANNLPTDGSILLPLGGLTGGTPVNGMPARNGGTFGVNTTAASVPVSPAQAGALIGTIPAGGAGKGLANDVAARKGLPTGQAAGRPATFGVPGLSFPFLDDSSQIFGLLVGRDAVLVRWDAGTLEAKAGFSYDFGPIMVGPVPITITIGGEIGIRGRFAIGYDTSGIRQLLDGGSGLALFDGIFIDDLDANGNDVPEIKFFGRVFAGASVDLVIVSAGVRGGIELTFSLDLDDRPDPDGKLRILEIVDKLANPICLFVVSGKIEAFLEAFVKIDLFFYSKEFSFELVRITLLEWSSACEPPSPVLSEPAAPADGVLYLNVGSRRDRRNIQEEQIHESIEVRQIGPNKVRVSGMGWEETREGIGLIVADGGAGADELKFLSGTVEGSDPEVAQEWTIPVVASGGPGNDIIAVGGTSADHLFGDATIGAGSWAGKAYSAIAAEGADADDTANADHINAGGGDDSVETGPGNDTADGQFGRDTLRGGAGNDNLSGGPGDDVVNGEADDDTVQGGPIPRPSPITADADDDDVLAGGTGVDVASGDFGDDWIFGDDFGSGSVVAYSPSPDGGRLQRAASLNTAVWCAATAGADGPDILTGTDGNDILVGGGSTDQIDAGNGNDFACGGDDNDTILGGNGDDTLQGDDGQDTISGNAGADLINGGNANDVIHGDAGDDDIFGDAGADLLFGDDGDDIVVGDTGALESHQHGVGSSADADATIVPERVAALDTALTETSTTSGARRSDCMTLSGAYGDSDCLFGGNGSDAMFGGSDGDVLFGDSGADLVAGNHGDDDLHGGVGHDLLLGMQDSDAIAADSGNDGAFGDRSIADWSTNTPTTGGADAITGGPGNDHLEGDGDNDDIDGGAGNDHLEGNNGNDALRGGVDDDDIIGGSDTESTVGDSNDVGDTAVFGGPGRDVIAGDNALIAATGYVLGRSVTLLDIEVVGVGGGDTLEGDAGSDAIFGQAGDDTLEGDFGGTGAVVGAAGNDYIEGNAGDDTVVGDLGADDLVGGGSATDGAIIAGRIGTGLADGDDDITGGAERDWIAGDNARFDRVIGNGIDYPADDVTPIQLFDLSAVGVAALSTASGADTVSGGNGSDIIFGQGGFDILDGDDDADYVEGNDGDDTINGGKGNDDLVGGGSATNGLIETARTGTGLRDTGELLIAGGDGRDSIAGDNARMNRVLFATADYPSTAVDPIVLFDLARTGSPDVLSNPATFGDDTASGGDDTDVMFGQGGADELSGGDADDYMEGNDGDDSLWGDDGADDVIGGGSANDGVIDMVRVGDGLHDVGEALIDGGLGNDWLMGDNAFSNRVLFEDDVIPITLFDVNSSNAKTSGGDVIDGNVGDELIFGQGNGYQGEQSDPDDGLDNDGDGFVDEDALGWLGDTLLGSAGNDYIEGNHGADYIEGDEGRDDIAGGGSAIDGIIDADRLGNGLLDQRDTIWGGADDDAIGGDNVRILPAVSGPLWRTNAREVLLFDVNSFNDTLSGGDFIGGNEGDDVIFGQGNGAQSASQADPKDGVDNDLDGREGVASSEYDCYDGFDNDNANGIDTGGCAAGIDEDTPWMGDTILGGPGVDYAEGNHGADWMFGDAGDDDLVGGGSAIDGLIDQVRTGVGLHDGPDVINGNGDNDVMAGDNAVVNRVLDGGSWQLIANSTVQYDILDRVVSMATSPESLGNFGNDHLRGGDDHDGLYGQQGRDLIEANAGDDGVVGDLGTMVLSVSNGPDQLIQPYQPFIKDNIFAAGTLNHLTTLFAQNSGGLENNDIIIGGQGHDDLHGGPGNDIMNGDRFGDTAPPSPNLITMTPGGYTADNTTTGVVPFANEDAMFGGYGDDVMWGGRDPDHLYGGHGSDKIDVRPRPATSGYPRDPASWFSWTRVFVTTTNSFTEEHYQDSDTISGGWGADEMQANLSKPGPNDGDQMFDSVGAYNLYYICPPHYGSYTAVRTIAPGLPEFFNDLAAGDGLFDPATSGSSGFLELGFVYNTDANANSNPAHPETPGHYYCGAGASGGGGSGGGGKKK